MRSGCPPTLRCPAVPAATQTQPRREDQPSTAPRTSTVARRSSRRIRLSEKPCPVCCTTATGGAFAGSADRTLRSASTPPVDAPIRIRRSLRGRAKHLCGRGGPLWPYRPSAKLHQTLYFCHQFITRHRGQDHRFSSGGPPPCRPGAARRIANDDPVGAHRVEKRLHAVELVACRVAFSKQHHVGFLRLADGIGLGQVRRLRDDRRPSRFVRARGPVANDPRRSGWRRPAA